MSYKTLIYGVVGLVFILCVSVSAVEEKSRPSLQMRSEIPSGSEVGRQKLPFSFEEIAVYFATALETKPKKLEGKCVVFTRSESNGFQGFHETVLVVIKSVQDDLSVTLLTNADYGMNYFREFIESQYFFPEESERLYYLLHNAPSVQWKDLKRFRVQLNVMQTADWEIVGLTISPHSLLDLEMQDFFPLSPGE